MTVRAELEDPFTYEIRVGWGDCDPARIAYTAKIPDWALKSIDAWWGHHLGQGGWFHLEIDREVGTPFVSLNMEFRAPITPRHPLICKVWPNRLGTTSVGFRVDGYQDGVLCFEGRFVNVFTDAVAFRKNAPPEDIRALVERYLRPDDAGQA